MLLPFTFLCRLLCFFLFLLLVLLFFFLLLFLRLRGLLALFALRPRAAVRAAAAAFRAAGRVWLWRARESSAVYISQEHGDTSDSSDSLCPAAQTHVEADSHGNKTTPFSTIPHSKPTECMSCSFPYIINDTINDTLFFAQAGTPDFSPSLYTWGTNNSNDRENSALQLHWWWCTVYPEMFRFLITTRFNQEWLLFTWRISNAWVNKQFFLTLRWRWKNVYTFLQTEEDFCRN